MVKNSSEVLESLKNGLREFHFVTASSSEEVLLHRWARTTWFGAEEYITANQMGTLDDDGRDNYSLHFLAYKEGEVVGCSRITLPSAPLWYIDQYCDLPPLAFPRERTGEISRQGVEPRYRRDLRASSLIQMGLIREMVKASKVHHLELLLTGVHRRYYNRLHRLLANYGFPCNELLGATVRGSLEGYEGYLEKNPDPVVLILFELERYQALLSTE